MRKRTLDLELEAIATVTNALARLSPDARTRVIGYALKHLEEQTDTTPQPMDEVLMEEAERRKLKI